MQFAERTAWESSDNPLSQALSAIKYDGQPWHDLTVSNPTQCGFDYSSKLFLRPLRNSNNLIYSPKSRGLQTAREEVVKYYASKNQTVYADRMLLTASSSEAYNYIFRLLFNPGDRVLIPSPSYPLFNYLAQINDADVALFPLRFEKEKDSWRIDFDHLAAVLTEKTKAIILVNPNNPTGSYIQKDELERLTSICQERNLAIICDEVFTDFPLAMDDNNVTSLVDVDKVLTFVIGGLSKALAMPQMKLSWVCVNGPRDVVDLAMHKLDIIADTFLSVATPPQNALEAWFDARDHIQSQIMTRLQTNLEILISMLTNNPSMHLLPVHGGWYVSIRIDGVEDDEEFAINLLQTKRTYVHPGYLFDFDDSGYIVLSLLTQPEDWKKGIKQLLESMNK